MRPSCRRSAKPNKRQKRRLEVAIPNQRIFARLGSRFSLLERVFPFLPGGTGSRRKRSPADFECVMHRTVKTVSVSSFGERLDVRPANRAGSHNWWAPRWPLRSLPIAHRFANPGIMLLRTLRPLTRTPNTGLSLSAENRRPGNAHESFSRNSMSAYRILGPGVTDTPSPFWEFHELKGELS